MSLGRKVGGLVEGADEWCFRKMARMFDQGNETGATRPFLKSQKVKGRGR